MVVSLYGEKRHVSNGCNMEIFQGALPIMRNPPVRFWPEGTNGHPPLVRPSRGAQDARSGYDCLELEVQRNIRRLEFLSWKKPCSKP